ncbi:bifunctional 3,4-dihydroxy-2-butanone 4-phosphate synthase/GTP cyclohydrolase II [Campylobacter hominis]
MVSVEQALEDIKNGKMIVMVDDVDRENEGDLVFAANFTNLQKVNFAITHAKGVLCVALDEANAKRLGLELMVDKNTSNHETAFTVTIDAKEAITGVSAFERNMTIALMAKQTSKPADFVRPGHIFPLIAKKGGVLSRTGHTEGSTDLCRLAGILPMAAICEIVKSDGNMARRDDLEKFCKVHSINMISVAQIVEYRLKKETLIKFGEKQIGEICGFKAEFFDIKDHEANIHRAYIFGEISNITNVKFHKISTDLNFLSSPNFTNFMEDIKFLDKNGGILLMLNSKTKDSENFKDYGVGAQILAALNAKKIKILSASAPKEYAGISGFEIDII